MMNFVCDRDEMINAIKRVSKVIPTKSTFKDLEGVLLTTDDNVLMVTGYDLDISITRSIDCKVTGYEYGSIIVNPKLLINVLKNMSSSTVSFSLNENYVLTISADNREYQIPCISSDTYPSLPNVDEAVTIGVKQGLLRDILNKTIYAISNDDSKPIMTGELFEIANGELNVVALDGRRLSVATIGTTYNGNTKFVVPGRMLKELLNNFDVHTDSFEWLIHVDKTMVEFECGDCSLITRLIDGEFHNWRSTIPSTHTTEVSVDKTMVLKTIKGAKLLLNEKNKSPLKFNIKQDTLEVSVKTGIGNFKDVLPIEKDGNDLTIGFNLKFFEEAAKAVVSDNLTVRFNGSKRVVQIIDGNTIHIVCPLQLKGE